MKRFVLSLLVIFVMTTPCFAQNLLVNEQTLNKIKNQEEIIFSKTKETLDKLSPVYDTTNCQEKLILTKLSTYSSGIYNALYLFSHLVAVDQFYREEGTTNINAANYSEILIQGEILLLKSSKKNCIEILKTGDNDIIRSGSSNIATLIGNVIQIGEKYLKEISANK